jgi:ABC-type Fe3+-hydroxamate transport system substrate-binding protein
MGACGDASEPGSHSAAPLADTPAPRRVVALSPIASQWVAAIGAGHLLVGVDEASRQVPALAAIPVATWDDAADLAPDLVLVPAPPPPGDPAAERLLARGARWAEFAPHSLEDVFELGRTVGVELVGAAEALRYETQVARPLALIGGSSFGQPRPRVLAVVGLDPLELAGGHSFETDLIEIAGGSSLTHGGSEPRLAVSSEQLTAYGADLVLVVAPAEPTDAEQRAARDRLPPAARIEFFVLDRDFFWLREPTKEARHLRAVIEPLSRELAARR